MGLQEIALKISSWAHPPQMAGVKAIYYVDEREKRVFVPIVSFEHLSHLASSSPIQ